MKSKKDPVYTEKKYCPACQNVYQYMSYGCEVCGHLLSRSFVVDDRFASLRRFRAARSMHQYNIKMGNI